MDEEQELNDLIEDLHQNRDVEAHDSFAERPLKVPPQYGVYLWWPVDENWVHPEDLHTAKELIPSNRVFRKESYDDQYSLLLYGTKFIRVRPVIWLQVENEGFELGDLVEVKSQMGKGHPLIATINEIRWEDKTRRINYSLYANGRAVRRAYTSDEFQLVQELESALDERKLRMLEQARRSI